jgi:NAD(P)-dependent dehydrogenase (short-subunit alcohol dehydrogenase family)
MDKKYLNKNFNLKNKTILLTGSAGRLGSNFAKILCEAESNLILIDINEKENLELKKQLKKQFNRKIETYSTNISSKKELEKMKNEIIEKYGKIDGLINNAFFSPRKAVKKSASKFEEFSIDTWNEMLNVNLTGVFLCSQIIGKEMAKKRNGVIVNISSIYGMVGADQRIYGNSNLNSSVAYAATKGAILNLTRYLAAYWQGKNVRVNSLTLGGVLDKKYMKKEFIKNYSNKTTLGRMAFPNEYNGIILFLMSNASSYMTGSNLIADGGWTAW